MTTSVTDRGGEYHRATEGPAVGRITVSETEVPPIAMGDVVHGEPPADARVAVIMLVEAGLAIEPDPGEIGVDDEVDEAGDGFRAISRGSAAGQHLDALDQRGGDEVKVGRLARAVRVTRGQPATVDQRQGALRTEVTKIDFGGAGRAVRHARGLRSANRRQLVEEILDAGRAGQLDVLARDHRDRRRRGQIYLRNARTRYDDVGRAAARGGPGRRRRRGGGVPRGGRRRAGPRPAC